MIHRWDFRYSIVKCFVDTALRINCNKLVITGKDNIPKDVPIIFTPNHRNALIDALLLVYATPHSKQIVFLGRGDIFKKKFIAWILRGARIIPVFRIRDGKNNLGRNEEIFETAAKVLKSNNPIGIFPEANHNPKQSLLPIKKAVPRIVLPMEHQYNFELNTNIIPVSIYYTNVAGFLSDCYVHFGEPIKVDNYKEEYNSNPSVAINKLRADMETELKKIVVDIWNDEYYDEYYSLLNWKRDTVAKELFPKEKDATAKAARHIVREMDNLFHNDREAFDNKIAKIRETNAILEEYNISNEWKIEPTQSSFNLAIKSIALGTSSPIALFGFANCILPIIIQKKLQSLFKDKQFISSVRYVAGLFLIPLFAIIQSLIVYGVVADWWVALAYFVAMPSSFLFAVHWRKWRREIKRVKKVNKFSRHQPLKMEEVLNSL